MAVRMETPFVTCPSCHADTVNVVEFTSAIAVVWYLRCTACAHLWTVDKDASGTRPRVRRALSRPDVQILRGRRVR